MIAAVAFLADPVRAAAQDFRVRLVDQEAAVPLGGLQRCPMCPMAIVIDGQQQYPPASPGVVSIDRLLDANDVAGIEVYARAGNMPVGLQVNDTKCGVIAFWTGSRH